MKMHELGLFGGKMLEHDNDTSTTSPVISCDVPCMLVQEESKPLFTSVLTSPSLCQTTVLQDTSWIWCDLLCMLVYFKGNRDPSSTSGLTSPCLCQETVFQDTWKLWSVTISMSTWFVFSNGRMRLRSLRVMFYAELCKRNQIPIFNKCPH